MSKNKFYYIFCNDKYVDTIVGIPGLAKFLNRPIESVYTSMYISKKKNKKDYTLKSYEGIKYTILNEQQFFGKGNLK